MGNGALISRTLDDADRKRLRDLVASEASNYANGPQAYFGNLIKGAALTEPFKRDAVALLTPDPDANALLLFRWAEARGGNPQPSERPWTTLGTILRALLETDRLGVEGIALISCTVDKYILCPHEAKRAQFRAKYGVPTWTSPGAAED